MGFKRNSIMITYNRLNEIKKEVAESVNKAFDEAKLKDFSSYALLIAGGDYQKSLENTRLLPYVIDSTLDQYSDQTR